MSIICVVYVDESREAVELPPRPLTQDVDALRVWLEEQLSLHASLISYWSYAQQRYDLLTEMHQVQQTEAEVLLPREGSSSSYHNDDDAPRTYRVQLWVETVVLSLARVSRARDADEMSELSHLVAHPRAGVGYELVEAIRITHPSAARNFDAARARRPATTNAREQSGATTSSSSSPVELLFYTNNAWSLTEVLQSGFCCDLAPSPPLAKEAIDDGGAWMDELPPAKASSNIHNTREHPFVFSSQLDAVRASSSTTSPDDELWALLCEVYRGNVWEASTPLLHASADDVKMPDGFDCARFRRGGGVELMVQHSHQALARYVLRIRRCSTANAAVRAMGGGGGGGRASSSSTPHHQQQQRVRSSPPKVRTASGERHVEPTIKAPLPPPSPSPSPSHSRSISPPSKSATPTPTRPSPPRRPPPTRAPSSSTIANNNNNNNNRRGGTSNNNNTTPPRVPPNRSSTPPATRAGAVVVASDDVAHHRPTPSSSSSCAAGRCATHPQQLLALFCKDCAALACPLCVTLGNGHKDHVLEAVEVQAARLRLQAQKWMDEMELEERTTREAMELLRAEQDLAHQRATQGIMKVRKLFGELHHVLQRGEDRLCASLFGDRADELERYAAELSVAQTQICRAREAIQQELVRARPNVQAVGGVGAATNVMSEAFTTEGALMLVNAVMEVMHLHGEEAKHDDGRGVELPTKRSAVLEGAQRRVDELRLAADRSERVLHNLPLQAVRQRLEALGDGGDGGGHPNFRVSHDGQPPPPPLLHATSSRRGSTTPARSPPRTRRLLASSMSGRDDAEAPALMERCLLDLQRGHIWAIQNASHYFHAGQPLAVCSTPFWLLGAEWELRIAPLLPVPVKTNHNNINTATTRGNVGAEPHSPLPLSAVTTANNNNNNVLARTSGSCGVVANNTRDDDGDDEHQWMGLFLCPCRHRLRMDFRVIAFSEVSWTEWRVTGWKETYAGKGWGLHNFLRRRELMRSDKLARGNVVKICIAPISDVY